MFAAELYRYVSASPLPLVQWDLIVPLPSSAVSLRERGYNHTGMLAQNLSELTGIRCSLFGLRASRPRKRQVALTAEERLHNTRGAFVAVARTVAGKRILVVDDVLTTGASICAAACALYSAGARDVDALTIARSAESTLVRRASAAGYYDKRTRQIEKRGCPR